MKSFCKIGRINGGMNRFLLEITAFIVGGVIMILELVGSRILAPFVGTSIFVWTSLIGIVLGSLSLGYYLGGKMADKRPTYKNLSSIIFLAAIFIFLLTVTKTIVLSSLQALFPDVRISSTIAALVLFSFPSTLLGMVSPYTVKLKMKELSSSGATVGSLYALSTVGSILGTFLTGFFLMAYLGETKILLSIAAVLALLSFLVFSKEVAGRKIFFLSLLLLSFLRSDVIGSVWWLPGLINVDTSYNKVWIYEDQDDVGRKIRRMNVNNELSSAMFLENDELVYDYTKYYRLAAHFKPGLKSSLMMGGAGYSYPKDYLKRFPEAKIDVVEIDPDLTRLAKKYFRLEETPRLTVYHEDGRTFLNTATKKYDAIFIDAFKSYSIPYQLTTFEAVGKIYELLMEEGIVLVNIVSALEGEKGRFLRAEYATYLKVFPQSYLFWVESRDDVLGVQNIMLLAMKSDRKPVFQSDNLELDTYLSHVWRKEIKTDLPVLTDDFSPVDHYQQKVLVSGDSSLKDKSR